MRSAFACVAVLLALTLAWMVVADRGDPHREGSDGLCSSAHGAEDVSAPVPRWAVDPARPGPNLPPAGRSVFDSVATRDGPDGWVYDIPFPLEALVARIEARAGCAPPKSECTRQVLIPLGRSLQRTAASPDFFAYPRVVIAVDREGSAGRGLKDRLYLGYQEKANLIEVISYNETAGRFEFQLVKDYRAGGRPRIVYANRSVCIACHQNHAPLFSRQQWDETNANPRVAARIANTRQSFHGIAARRGVEVANAIDDSIHRANLRSVDNLLWRQGCGSSNAEGARCRAAVLVAAWQYRLSGGRGFDSDADDFRAAVAILSRNALSQWPGGLAVPNPEIPNRDPLAFSADATGLAMTHVSAALDPLAPRAPLAVWDARATDFPGRLVTGIATLLADADVRGVDTRLALLADRKPAVQRTLGSTCELRNWESELRFRCRPGADTPGMALNGRAVLGEGRVASGELASVAVNGAEPLLHFELGPARIRSEGYAKVLWFAPHSRGLRPRLPDGRAIASIELRWMPDGTGAATATLVDEFGPLREAFAAMVAGREGSACLASAVFDPAVASECLADRLGMPQRHGSGKDAIGLPPLEDDEGAATAAAELPEAAAVFQRNCVPCHQTPEPVPPNFLYGNAQRVRASLAHCAQRIFVRVSMWQLQPEARDKTPMPPAFATRPNGPGRVDQGPDPAAIDGLRSAAAEMLRAQSGRAPSLDELLVGGYENLRPCLPAGA